MDEPSIEQHRALIHDGNVVLFAGPGSGKTKTLIDRAEASLLHSSSRFSRIACITYTNAAANEIVTRLSRRGLEVDRVFAGTVHSFCLREIIAPYRRVANLGKGVPTVAGEDLTASLLIQAYNDEHIADLEPQYRQGEITRIRRALFLGESVAAFDDREVRAARRYENALGGRGLLDYESILQDAVKIIANEHDMRERLETKFSLILVDEYQDLGGILHLLVSNIASSTKIKLFCVGDPNQSIFGFTGADPRYMTDLANLKGFTRFDLTHNFRSHPDIISASGAVISEVALPGKLQYAPSSAVRLTTVEGWLDDHARAVGDVLEAGVAGGKPLGAYAVLYSRKGVFLDLLEEEFKSRNLRFVHERQTGLPAGPLADFVRACASRAVLELHLSQETDPAL